MLDEYNIEYTERHIVEDNPTYDELKKMVCYKWTSLEEVL